MQFVDVSVFILFPWAPYKVHSLMYSFLILLPLCRADFIGRRKTLKANSISAIWEWGTLLIRFPAWPLSLPTSLTCRWPSKKKAAHCLTTAPGPRSQTSPCHKLCPQPPLAAAGQTARRGQVSSRKRQTSPSRESRAAKPLTVCFLASFCLGLYFMFL